MWAHPPHPHRCIKPNNAKVANNFDAKMCIEQLTYAGVFEAVKIRKSGYPFRLTHSRFASRYRCIAWKNVPTKSEAEGMHGRGIPHYDGAWGDWGGSWECSFSLGLG